jgi:hypothetical protein
MRPEEKVIQERRTIEAMKANLMGPDGKLGLIAKFLGEPIVRQGSPLHEEHYLDDPYDYVPEDPYDVAFEEDMRTSDITDVSYDEGLVFSGLRLGMHIDIHLHEAENEIIVWYKGYEVYREKAGDLYAYAPFPEWENMVEKLYKMAQKKEKEAKNDLTKMLEMAVRHEKKSFFQKLRLKWGI